MTDWICTEERLPEGTGKKCYEHVYCLVMYRYVRILAWNTHEKCWDDDQADDYVCDAMDVTHWMPLPEPPQ